MASRLVLLYGLWTRREQAEIDRRALLQSNLDWFNHYIWNEPIPKDSPIYGTSELETSK